MLLKRLMLYNKQVNESEGTILEKNREIETG